MTAIDTDIQAWFVIVRILSGERRLGAFEEADGVLFLGEVRIDRFCFHGGNCILPEEKLPACRFGRRDKGGWVYSKMI